MCLIGGIILKKWKKYLYCLLLTAVLGMMSAVFFFVDKGDTRVMFCVESASGTQQIALYDGGAGEHILFLPSYAELERVSLSSDLKNGIVIDGIAMTEGASCAGFALDEPYALTIDGREAGTIRFCRSANVATTFVNTATGSMERIHLDKNYQENTSLFVYHPDGMIDYQSDSALIKGRGNSTWTTYEKKPYKLDLSTASELLGMAAGTEWILLANAFDTTNLRNKLVYDFAEAHEPYPGFAADSRFVDLYLNGEYAGLYLLTEKLDVGENRLEINPESFYFEILYPDRVLDSDAAFLINPIRAVKTNHPADCTEEQLGVLEAHVTKMQEALYSIGDSYPGAEKAWEMYIDLDSWARKFLIEEMFVNASVGNTSQFFWWDPSGEKIFAGPCWDYDLALGTFWGISWTTPYCLLTQCPWGDLPSWYMALWEKEEFRQHVLELYKGEFLPAFQELIAQTVYEQGAIIEAASFMDYLRWPGLYPSQPVRDDWEMLAGYLEDHTSFLSDIWLNETQYCVITLQPNNAFILYFPYGMDGTNIPSPAELGLSSAQNWIVQENGELFDPHMPITQDVTLMPETVTVDLDSPEDGLALRDYITFASIAFVVFVFMIFIVIDFRRSMQEGRRCDVS